jgi:C-terminal processing protease CtpA/Prc
VLVRALQLLRPLFVVFLVSCTPVSHGTIGAMLGQQNDGRLFIRATPQGLAAAEAGLEPGDEILFIEGIEARTLTPEQISELLGGPVGAPVQLTVLRNEEVLRVTLERTEAEKYSPAQDIAETTATPPAASEIEPSAGSPPQ